MSNSRYELDTPDQKLVNRKSTKLLYVSVAKYGGDWNSIMHAHACTELFYVVGGQGQFRVSDRLLPLSPDDIVIVNPNVEHTELSLNASPLEYIVLGVEGLEFCISDDSGSGYSKLSLSAVRDEILPCLQSMLLEIENKQDGYEIVCQDLLEVLIVRLMRQGQDSLIVSPEKSTRRECAAVKRYVDSHFKESLSLEQLADIAHVNKYHLSHIFRKEYGTSPINYLIARRISESCHLLAETDLSLSQISQTLGFSSPSYFSQSFRKVMEMTPQEFRGQKRKG